ncbi:hypothetical protein [Chlamydiifrater volucris]|uniref:hypothetical protein n=1 Tax=Chlamydiifrater volucris TaxID=2681470 RepID=UPI001BD01CA7|nr:hypothetical protein [Chlamydiifrater volucris]
MSPKSISHFAVLSILLTFSHSIGSAAVSSNNIASVAESSVGRKSRKSSAKSDDLWKSQSFLGKKVTSKNVKPEKPFKGSSCRDTRRKATTCVERGEDSSVKVLNGVEVESSPAETQGGGDVSDVKERSSQAASVSSSGSCAADAQVGKKAKKEGGESLKLTNPFKVVNKALNEDQARRVRDKKEMNSQPRKSLIHGGNRSQRVDQPCICSEDKEYSKKEVEEMIESLARAKRVSKRKSAREAALTKAEQSRVPRNHSVTSSLRFDKERAAAIKKNRDEKRKSQQSKVKEEAPRRVSRTEVRIPLDRGNSSSDQDNSMRTNLSPYEAVRFRCDQAEWPCSSCVTKRRAHRGISVCTMVMTVLAMIISGIIIVNASDSNSTENNTPGTGGGAGVPGVPGAAAAANPVPAFNF